MLDPAPKEKRYNSRKGFRQQFLFKQRALVVIVVTISVCITLGLYGVSLSNRVQNIDNQWTAYDSEASAAAHSLGLIKSHFGYGGFIHNFKNYVLRKDASLVARIKNDLRDTYRAIDEYPLVGSHETAHEGVEQAIKTIRRVVDLYSEKFELTQKLIAEEKAADIIDQQVQIDDRSALEAFKFLNEYILQHSREQVLKTNLAVDNTLWLLSWGMLLLPGVLFIGGIVILFIRYDLRINKQLEDSHQYLSHLFKSAPDAMLIVDKAGVIIDSNLRAVDLLGYSRDELCNLRVEDLIPERFRQQHVKIREGSFKKPVQRTFNEQTEFSALTKDGKEVPVEISLNYITNENETQAITTLRDVTERKQIEKSLRHKENMLRKAQKITHIGSWEWDLTSNRLVWSDEIFEIFGLSSEELDASYDGFVERLHPEDREAVINAVNEAVVYDKPYNIDHRIVRPNGEERYVKERGDVFRDQNGEAQYMVGTVLDITEQKRAEQELRLADNVFNHTTEAILVTDFDNKILRVNQAFEFITGYSAQEVIGKRPQHILGSSKQDKEFYDQMWSSLNSNGFWEGEIWDKRKNGVFFPAWHNISAIKDETGNVFQYTSIFSDITEKKIAEERIQHLAQFDQLTQLPNRALFNDRLKHALAIAKRSKTNVGLMFIDLDHFKNVNDTLGHQAGDQLLQEVARRLTSCVREQDTVARLGGDEFTIIMEALTQPEDAALVANKILESLSRKVQLGEDEVTIGGSIGISFCPDDATDTENLTKYADIAMYQAKNQGKNQYQFYTKE